MKDFLFIHPQDETTAFLSIVYRNMLNDNNTLVSDNYISNSSLNKLLQSHRNIIILGHGCQDGLLCQTNKYDRFNRLMINSKHVQALRNANMVIGIWCHSDKFFDKYRINGFASGMFVSDIDEANDYCLPLSSYDIEESNALLAKSLSEILPLTYDSNAIYEYLKTQFIKISSSNRIAKFNCNNFQHFKF